MRSDAENETISVVIPTYYRNDRLREAIASVRTQEHDPVELIVVDGSGEAHARPVVDGDDDVRYVAQERDEGPQVARSVGAERATGRYVQFLDDDDRLLPEKFEKQLPLFDESVGVVYSGLVDEDWGEVSPVPAVRGAVLEQALTLRTFPCIPSTMLVDRRVLERLLPLGNRHGADDSGTKIELARLTEFDYVDEPLVERGKPPETLSSSWAHIEGRKRLLRTYADLYDAFPSRVRRTAVRQTHYREGRKRLEERRWSLNAIAAFARAAYYTPDDRRTYVRDFLASFFGRPGLRVVDELGS